MKIVGKTVYLFSKIGNLRRISAKIERSTETNNYNSMNVQWKSDTDCFQNRVDDKVKEWNIKE